MTNARRTAYRLRRLILVAGILYTIAAVCWIVLPFFSEYVFADFMGAGLRRTPLVRGLDDHAWTYGIGVTLIIGLLLFAQWVFLRPVRGFAISLAVKGRPLKSAVIPAAAMAMLLTVGLIALILEVPDWWEPIIDGDARTVSGLWLAMLLLWSLWAWIFFAYWRQGDRYTQLGKMIRALVAGSLLEMLVAVPAHVWVMRQQKCYCVRGTYTTLVLAGTVLLWAFGPGIVLLYLREKHRRAKLIRLCDSCGYNLTGNTSGVCPECGTPVTDDAQ